MYINNSDDLETLRQKINLILGQPCWKVDLGYGQELFLEIGEKISYAHPLLSNEYKGAWHFGSRGTDWQLSGNNRILVTSDVEPEEILSKSKVIEGSEITYFDIEYPSLMLTIKFNTIYQLNVIPDLTDTEYQDIACWELFTPNHRILEIYPNFTWYDRPSDVPISELIHRA